MSEMINKIKCDIAIIGAGAAGLSVAAGAAQFGVKVVLIESGKMGGDCLNYGCIPSKSLLAAAKNFLHLKQAHALGINVSATVDFAKVMQHIKKVIQTISVHDSVERFEKLGVKVILGTAKFVNANTLQTENQFIHAKRFIIATGSTAFVPPISGLENTTYYTNETIFDLAEQPKHLIVIGGGPIGCELAQAFALLGTTVTLVEAMKLLPKDEPDCVDIIRQQLINSGIRIYENAHIQNLQEHDHEITLNAKQGDNPFDVTGTHLLIATGRRANVQSLNLELAKVHYSPKGINVDQRLRTSNKKIYAIGDVIGQYQFTHIANYHANIALKNILFNLFSKVDHRSIPWITYTAPELAHVGLTLAEAELQHNKVNVTEWPFAENDRAIAEHQTLGKIKIITGKKAKILGVTIVGTNAGELLLPWIIAIREQKNLRALTDVIVPYPTLSEISKRVASEFYAPLIFSNKVKMLVKILQFFK